MNCMDRRVYVSAPMRGVEGENRPLFLHVGDQLRNLGLTPMLPPDIVGRLPRDAGIREFMAADLGVVCKEAAAVVVVGKYWQVVASKGVWAERMAAYAVGIPVFTQGTTDSTFNPNTWRHWPMAHFVGQHPGEPDEEQGPWNDERPLHMSRWLANLKASAHISRCT